MRLKSYLIAGFTAAALFGASPALAFADDTPAPPSAVPSPAEEAPTSPEATPTPPEAVPAEPEPGDGSGAPEWPAPPLDTPVEEECWAELEESGLADAWFEGVDSNALDGECGEMVAEWIAELEASGVNPPAAPAEALPADPNYTG
jgi:hypothetical protein